MWLQRVEEGGAWQGVVALHEEIVRHNAVATMPDILSSFETEESLRHLVNEGEKFAESSDDTLLFC